MRVNIRVKLRLGSVLRGQVGPMKREARRGVADVTGRFLERVDKSFDEIKTGKKYPGLPRRSSARGEAPARQSGTLAGSVVVLKKRGGMQRVVSFRAKYAEVLETTMERPYLAPQMLQVERELAAFLNERVPGVMRTGVGRR